MASSNEARVTHVKVSENRDFVDDYCGSSSLEDAGEGAKRRRTGYDGKNPSQQGCGTSVSTDPKHTAAIESKGINSFYTYLLILYTLLWGVQ